jgi:hypothetical protein
MITMIIHKHLHLSSLTLKILYVVKRKTIITTEGTVQLVLVFCIVMSKTKGKPIVLFKKCTRMFLFFRYVFDIVALYPNS